MSPYFTLETPVFSRKILGGAKWGKLSHTFPPGASRGFRCSQRLRPHSGGIPTILGSPAAATRGMGREVEQAMVEGGERGGGRPRPLRALVAGLRTVGRFGVRQRAGPELVAIADAAGGPGRGCPWTCPLAGARVRGGPGPGRARPARAPPTRPLLLAGSAAPATRDLAPCQSRPGGRSAGRKPHPAHASLLPHRPPRPQHRRTLFQPPRAPPGSRRPAPRHHPHHRHRPRTRTARATRTEPCACTT